jgi:MoxR-like ATPase
MDDKWRKYANSHETVGWGGKWDLAGPRWRLPEREPEPEVVPADPPAAKLPPDFYYRATEAVIDTVNLALRLRRPILVTGAPGTGKTSLAYSVAAELGLGPVLEWLITSRSTVRDGLYQYDALARVNDMNLADKASGEEADSMGEAARDIGRYVTLGPLGDAMLPRLRPRVLLIDEIDKCDIDLPGDLLHVLDRGTYEIPELVRERETEIRVRRANAETGDHERVLIRRGQVSCYEFPLVILTSNDEREFPPAFQRRCLPLHLELPDEEALIQIASQKFGQSLNAAGIELIRQFLAPTEEGRGPDGRRRATSQLLNALYVRVNDGELSDEQFRKFCDIVLAPLSE